MTNIVLRVSVINITITADFHTLVVRVITVQTSQLVLSASLCRHIASWPAHRCRRVDDCCPGSLLRGVRLRENLIDVESVQCCC